MTVPVGDLFGNPGLAIADVNQYLRDRHYLGPATRGWAWRSDDGVMVFANPSSRRLPHDSWLELVRWCLTGRPNAGSQQWGAFVRWARKNLPAVTTFVSYSDPSVGHTGALYRACNWLWAPTWQRLRPPPTGNGAWTEGGKNESPKDRWVYPMRSDQRRVGILTVKDEAILRKFPEALYREPQGVPYAMLARIVGGST